MFYFLNKYSNEFYNNSQAQILRKINADHHILARFIFFTNKVISEKLKKNLSDFDSLLAIATK